ncbi:MAG: hypothetical protein KDC12_02435 [Flavobacteriales bacterium]|nr:hypothetical protein [Flavobacteriales bacterium]
MKSFAPQIRSLLCIIMGLTTCFGAAQSTQGCTDSMACNYNSESDLDDGSCCYTNCIQLEISSGSYDSEISWELQLLNDTAIIASGFAPFQALLCLENACYQLTMYDSFGDGWNGAAYSFTNAEGTVLATGSHSGGSQSDVIIGIGGICGCMDSTAYNYDSEAVSDDGSCVYAPDNDECESAMVLGPGYVTLVVSNEGASPSEYVGSQWVDGEAEHVVWFSYVVPNYLNSLTISTDPYGVGYGAGYMTDPQLAVWTEECGELTELASDDDDGTGLHSKIELSCFDGEIPEPGTVIYISLDGYSGQQGVVELTLFFNQGEPCYDPDYGYEWFCGMEGICDPFVLGCYDPVACNYNSEATEDDGSCFYDCCPPDLSGDGEVNIDDLLSFLGVFSCSSPPCDGDINEDGTTNVFDLLLLLGAYNTVCEY